MRRIISTPLFEWIDTFIDFKCLVWKGRIYESKSVSLTFMFHRIWYCLGVQTMEREPCFTSNKCTTVKARSRKVHQLQMKASICQTKEEYSYKMDSCVNLLRRNRSSWTPYKLLLLCFLHTMKAEDDNIWGKPRATSGIMAKLRHAYWMLTPLDNS